MLCEDVFEVYLDGFASSKAIWLDGRFYITIRLYSYTIYPKVIFCGFRWRSTDMGTGGESPIILTSMGHL